MNPDYRVPAVVLRYFRDPEWVPRVSQDVTDAIHSALPELDEDLRDSTYTSTESVLRQLVYMVRNQVSPVEADLPPAAIEYVRTFVRQGVSIDSLLRTFQVGHAAFFRNWAAASRATYEDPLELAEAIELGADWTFTVIETLSARLVAEYGEERDRWVRSAAAIRADIVDELLSGQVVDPLAAGPRLGYDLERDHRAFVLWNSDSAADQSSDGALAMLERAGLQLASSLKAAKPLLLPRGRELIAGWIGSRDSPRQGSSDDVRLDARSFPGALAAFGSRHRGVDGFRRSHEEALQARRVAELTRRQPGSVTYYGKVVLAALASADVTQARRFVADELGPLAADDDQAARLSATLLIYLEENMSPRRAANRLGVHENTIANRIRTAQEQLGHPIEQRSAELQVALRLVRLTRES
jgi:transposase-like protein